MAIAGFSTFIIAETPAEKPEASATPEAPAEKAETEKVAAPAPVSIAVDKYTKAQYGLCTSCHGANAEGKSL